MEKKRKRHNREQIVKKLWDVNVRLNAGKDLALLLLAMELFSRSDNKSRDSCLDRLGETAPVGNQP